MILGVIADDFTGAGDVAGILAGAGMRTALLPTVEDVAACRDDAGVVALKTRSVPVAEAVARSLVALEALRAAGARQILFKYCSTFDSTRQGNIGPVAEALAVALDAHGVVVCPAFPANGRTLYQGHLFVGGQLLSDSGMRDHPLTPMTDGDIRRWLAAQTQGPVGHVPLATVRAGAQFVQAALRSAGGLVVVDAIDDMDLRAIGRAVRDAPLVTGGSAIAQGLPDNFREALLIDETVADDRAVGGPAILLAGSCSSATNAQVARYAENAPAHAIDVVRLMAGEPVGQEACAFAMRHAAASPLIYSTVAPAGITRDDDDIGTVAAAVEKLLADLAQDAVARGAARIVVAGGETSGAVVERLAPGPLSVGRSIAPGVPVLYAGGLALALKSGNFGDQDFFAKALATIEGRE